MLALLQVFPALTSRRVPRSMFEPAFVMRIAEGTMTIARVLRPAIAGLALCAAGSTPSMALTLFR
jgi:hypothetical protein